MQSKLIYQKVKLKFLTSGKGQSRQ